MQAKDDIAIDKKIIVKESTRNKQESPHCNPVQGSNEFFREVPVMKTASLQ